MGGGRQRWAVASGWAHLDGVGSVRVGQHLKVLVLGNELIGQTFHVLVVAVVVARPV